jgi:hypothetical protein
LGRQFGVPKAHQRKALTVGGNFLTTLDYNHSIMKKIFTLLLVVAITQSIFGQKQNLGFNLKIGETYYYSLQSSSIIKQDINGQKVNIDVTISGKTAFKVTNQKDTVYDMTVNYEQLAMTMKLPNGEMNFNSDKQDENDIFSTILGTIKGKQFLMKMTKVGKIIEVKNLDSIFENLLDQFPKISSQQKQQIKAQILQAYGEKAFKGSYEMVTNIYSNSAVEKGNTWTINTKLESGMAATLLTTYEFKGKIENYNLIIGNGKFETLDKDAYTQINGMPVRYDLTGTMNSTLKVDVKTGWIIDAKVNQSMSGNAEIKDNPNLPGGLTIPMSFESIMTYSSK